MPTLSGRQIAIRPVAAAERNGSTLRLYRGWAAGERVLVLLDLTRSGSYRSLLLKGTDAAEAWPRTADTEPSERQAARLERLLVSGITFD